MNARLLALSAQVGSPETNYYRTIQFERYRKPSVVEYPARAVVLNPRHTHYERNEHLSDSKSYSSTTLDVTLNMKKRLVKEPDDDDNNGGDPMNMKESSFLCAEDEFKKILKLRWDGVGRMGRGLENLGNTCFLNAVLQCIAYTPALSQYFSSIFKVEMYRVGAPYDFAFALGETIRDMLSLHKDTECISSPYRPVKIVNQLSQLSPHFRRGRQCDAHEFAMQLLSHAQKSILFRLVENTKLPLSVANTSPLLRICGGYLMSQVRWKRKEEVEQLLKAGKKQMADDLTMEGKNVRVRKKMKVQGPSFHSKVHEISEDDMFSTTYDPMTILSVELAGKTLEQCLQKFCGREKLEGRCYQTPRQVGVHAQKEFKIHIPPNILIIQLKRFSHSGGKEEKYIKYPLELDLNPFCSSRSQQHGPHKYFLNACCIHSGSSINCGHYYAVVKGRNSLWYLCNDRVVKMVPESEALSKEAYMLFYSRCHPYSLHPEDGKEMQGNRKNSSTAVPSIGERALSLRAIKGDFALQGFSEKKEDSEGLGKAMTDEEVRVWKKHHEEKQRAHELQKSASAPPNSALPTSGPNSSGSPLSQLPFISHNIARTSDTTDSSIKELRPVKKQKVSMSYPVVTPSSLRFPSSFPPDPSGSTTQEWSNASSVYNEKALFIRSQQLPGACAHPFRSHGCWDGAEADKKRSKSFFRSSIATQSLNSIPEGIRRSNQLPKFQQTIRDPLWEMQMDQGRTKKVKSRHSASDLNEHGKSENPFQERSDSRFTKKENPH